MSSPRFDTPSFKRVPYRTGVIPQCGHDACLGLSQGRTHSIFSSCSDVGSVHWNVGGGRGGAPGPGAAAASSGGRGGRGGGRGGGGAGTKYVGPGGVATVFYRVVKPTASPAASASAPAAAASEASPDNNKTDAPTSPPAASPTTATDNNNNTPIVSFMLGYDKGRGKNSIFSGTLQDSWAKDAGCGVWGALREAWEEAKVHFKNDEEFLAHCAFWFWEANTLIFVIDLDAFSPSDPRQDFEATKERLRAALRDPSLPHCEKEITALTHLDVPLTAKTVRNSKLKVNHSGFCLQVCDAVFKTVQRVMLETGAPPPVGQCGGGKDSRGGAAADAAAAAEAEPTLSAPPLPASKAVAAGGAAVAKKEQEEKKEKDDK